MARDFNGTTDRIDYASAFNTTGQAFTWAGFVRLDDTNPAANQFLFNSAISGGGPGTTIYQQSGAAAQLVVTRAYSTTSKDSRTASNVFTATIWFHLIVTDDGSAGNFSNFYIDNVAAGFLNAAAVGTETTANSGFSLGGRTSDDLRNMNGALQHVGIWNRVISAAERESLRRGQSPLSLPNGLKFYARLIGDDYRNLLDNSGTLDGTSKTVSTRRVYAPHAPSIGFGQIAGDPAITSASTAPFTPGATVTVAGSELTDVGAGLAIVKIGSAIREALTSFNPSSAIAATGVIPNRPTAVPYTSASHAIGFTATLSGVATGSPTAAYAFNPPSGYSVVEVGTPDTSSASLCSAFGWTPVPTDQIEWDASVTVDGVTVAVTVNSDGTVDLDSSPDPVPATVSFRWRAWSSASGEWSASASDLSDWATATFGAGGGSRLSMSAIRRRRPR